MDLWPFDKLPTTSNSLSCVILPCCPSVNTGLWTCDHLKSCPQLLPHCLLWSYLIVPVLTPDCGLVTIWQAVHNFQLIDLCDLTLTQYCGLVTIWKAAHNFKLIDLCDLTLLSQCKHRTVDSWPFDKLPTTSNLLTCVILPYCPSVDTGLWTCDNLTSCPQLLTYWLVWSYLIVPV